VLAGQELPAEDLDRRAVERSVRLEHGPGEVAAPSGLVQGAGWHGLFVLGAERLVPADNGPVARLVTGEGKFDEPFPLHRGERQIRSLGVSRASPIGEEIVTMG
jgi:hypothetical protein